MHIFCSFSGQFAYFRANMNSYEQDYLDKKASEDPRKAILLKAERKVKDARLILYILGGIMLLFGFLFYFLEKMLLLDFIFNIVYGVVFFVLAFFVERYPKPIIITSIVLYSLKIALAAIVSPASLLSGIIIKVLFFAALYKGYQAADEVADLRRELGLMDEKEMPDQPIDLIK